MTSVTVPPRPETTIPEPYGSLKPGVPFAGESLRIIGVELVNKTDGASVPSDWTLLEKKPDTNVGNMDSADTIVRAASPVKTKTRPIRPISPRIDLEIRLFFILPP